MRCLDAAVIAEPVFSQPASRHVAGVDQNMCTTPDENECHSACGRRTPAAVVAESDSLVAVPATAQEAALVLVVDRGLAAAQMAVAVGPAS